MRKPEIDALLRAHGGRGRPVAFFHILRQPVLEADDHAFLLENAAELGASDLLRWRARCEPGFTGPIVRHLAKRAIDDPASFRHEVLDLPRIDMDDVEWRELADLVRGKVPEAIHAGVVARGGPRPERPPASFFFTPGKFDRAGLDDAGGSAGGPLAGAPRVDGIGERERPVVDERSLTTHELVVACAAGVLQLDDARLVAALRARLDDAAEDWRHAVVDFPAALRDVALDKAKRTPRADERANLLAWLDANGAPKADLFTIALSPLAAKEPTAGIVGWLAARLGTRAAWEKYGEATFTRLVEARAFAELGDLVAIVVSDAAAGGATRTDALVGAIHAAFAGVLVARARGALDARDPRSAAGSLSALACLDPPSRLSRAVHDLGADAADLDGGGDVLELIQLNVRLVKHGGREASLEGLVAALHALADFGR